MTFLATEDVYGPALYVVMPNMAPTAAQDNGTRLAELQARLPMIEEGLGRTAYEQVSPIIYNIHHPQFNFLLIVD